MGGTQMISYTLVGEPGTSLTASNWKRVAKSRGGKYPGSWETHPQNPSVTPTILKVANWRWEIS